MPTHATSNSDTQHALGVKAKTGVTPAENVLSRAGQENGVRGGVVGGPLEQDKGPIQTVNPKKADQTSHLYKPQRESERCFSGKMGVLEFHVDQSPSPNEGTVQCS